MKRNMNKENYMHSFTRNRNNLIKKVKNKQKIHDRS